MIYIKLDLNSTVARQWIQHGMRSPGTLQLRVKIQRPTDDDFRRGRVLAEAAPGV